MPIDRAGLAVGSIRLASGISFLVDPVRADAADLLGGMSVHHAMKPSQRLIGLGGAVVGIGVGLWGATRRRPRPIATDS